MNQAKLKNTLGAGLLLLQGALQAATLQLPEHIQVISVNGEKQGFNLFMTTSEVELPAGIVALKVRYKDLIESDFDDSHETVRSEDQALYFKVSSEASALYQITSARPDTPDAAHQFAKKPNFSILYQGTEVPLLEPQYRALEPELSATDAAEKASKAGKMLHFWWQQADKQTRSEFLKKVSENK